MQSRIPLGVRRNNPLNIRNSDANDWNGEIPESVTGIRAFESFYNPVDGFRAAAVLVQNYIDNYGLNTIQQIVNKWAPDHENPTSAYIEYVANVLEMSPAEPLPDDDNVKARLLWAMSHFENGKTPFGGHWYTLDMAKAGVAKA